LKQHGREVAARVFSEFPQVSCQFFCRRFVRLFRSLHLNALFLFSGEFNF